MIIIKLKVLLLVKEIKDFTKDFTLIFGKFRSNYLLFDTFSQFEITPLQYFNGDPPPYTHTHTFKLLTMPLCDGLLYSLSN